MLYSLIFLITTYIPLYTGLFLVSFPTDWKLSGQVPAVSSLQDSQYLEQCLLRAGALRILFIERMDQAALAAAPEASYMLIRTTLAEGGQEKGKEATGAPLSYCCFKRDRDL